MMKRSLLCVVLLLSYLIPAGMLSGNSAIANSRASERRQ